MQILAGLILLTILIVVHEFGHFIVAKFMKVRVLVFSIGFGPRLFSFIKGDTRYCICAIPLGGYIRMYGDQFTDKIPSNERNFSFLYQPIWKKFCIVCAGPLFNLLLPIILFFFIFNTRIDGIKPIIGNFINNMSEYSIGIKHNDRIISIDNIKVKTFQEVTNIISSKTGKSINILVERDTGNSFKKIHFILHDNRSSVNLLNIDKVRLFGLKEKELKNITISSTIYKTKLIMQNEYKNTGNNRGLRSVIGTIESIRTKSVADIIGLKKNDQLISLNGHKINISSLISNSLFINSNNVNILGILRDDYGLVFVFNVQQKRHVKPVNEHLSSVLGVKIVHDILHKIPMNFISGIYNAISRTFQIIAITLKSLVMLITGNISLFHLSGPIAIFNIAGKAAKEGLENYIFVMSIISVNLGILNLLPIPILDGGHLVIFIIEAIRRKSLSIKFKQFFSITGLIFLLVSMILILLNDIFRLFY